MTPAMSIPVQMELKEPVTCPGHPASEKGTEGLTFYLLGSIGAHDTSLSCLPVEQARSPCQWVCAKRVPGWDAGLRGRV